MSPAENRIPEAPKYLQLFLLIFTVCSHLHQAPELQGLGLGQDGAGRGRCFPRGTELGKLRRGEVM